MRLTICIIYSLLLTSVTISAQFLLVEDFSGYDTNSPVENARDITEPEIGEWVFVEEVSGRTTPTVVDEQLEYNNYVFSAKGKSMYTVPSDGVGNTVFCLSDTYLPYPCQPDGNFVEGSNEFYTAFLLDLSKTTSTKEQEIFSYYQLSTGVRRGSICYKLSEDKNSVAFSFQKRPEYPSTSLTKYYDKNTPLLLVVKYSHVCINEKNLGHAEFDLFINPNPTRTEEENNSLKLSAFGNEKGYDTDLRYINFRQSGETTMKIAGIRIANSFKKVLTGQDDTSVILPAESDFLFYTRGKTLVPNKAVNGKLSVYDISSCLLHTCNIRGIDPIETNLDTGIYILLYEKEGNKYVQKIIIQ